MPPSSTQGDVVVRLLDGRSSQRQMVLEGGRALPPIAVGTRGAWRIDAGHVADVHVMLAFNGASLFVCAFGGEKALLDGASLSTRWTEAKMPSELRFGSARLTIGRRAGPDEVTAVPVCEITRLADPSATAAPARSRAFPASAPARSLPREEEVTSFDEERLRAALQLVRDDEVTCIAQVDIPVEAKRASGTEMMPPAAFTRTMVMPSVAMPPLAMPPLALAPTALLAVAMPPAPAPLAHTQKMTIVAPYTTQILSSARVAAMPDSERTLMAPEAYAEPEPLPQPEPLPAPFPRSAPMLSPLAFDECDGGEVVSDDSDPGSSSMPPTMPSDGLMPAAFPSFGAPLPVAVSRPSQPTMAIPMPEDPRAETVEQTDPRLVHGLDLGHAPALAVSGEHASGAPSDVPVMIMPPRKADALVSSWKKASLPKKAIALLLGPALCLSMFAMRGHPSKISHGAGGRTEGPPPIVATPQPAETTVVATVTTAAATTASASAPAKAAATATASAGAAELPKAGAPGLRDTRTAERRALDTAASGQDTSAAEQYDALAAAHPENLAFREAARILRERSGAHHD